ncbi:MAG: L,D-transpeptidase, partial [Candidatus Margulisiibacteriota bacterium]|nr:L,D-transpeptidase [Candidatus Margulisiibacteriota bacterium]
MRKMFLGLLCIVLFSSIGTAEQNYESIRLINSTDWVKYFDEALGYCYDSHGCLHFTPSDIYLLYKTIPAGIPLTVKKYKLKKNEPPFPVDKIPFLRDKIDSIQDVKKHALMFKNYKSKIVIYPSLNLLFIFVNDYPYAKVKALAGLPYNFLMAYDVQKGRPVGWDFMLSTPTDPGEYKVLRVTDHYLSSAYYKNTIVPFGAWIKKVRGAWSYQKNGKWYKLPDNVVADLARKDEDRFYNYYDLHVDQKGRITAARYAGHDFGKYVLLWTKDGNTHYPEMGYAAGELLYEQIVLIKDMVHLLTVPSSDDLDSVISQNVNLKYYKELADPKKKKESLDKILSDLRIAKAVKEYKENRLPRDKRARWEALGLYNYYRANSLIIDKQAGWYEKVKQDWDLFKKLRIKLRGDFDQMGVLSVENRQNILEGWLNDRLEFKQVGPPKQAKYLTDLSFSNFFKPDDETTLFSARERAIMVERIRKAVKGEAKGLNLNIVDALNKYNFGVLLNEILGDLYKSHGCMHLSPRNAGFLYDLLPVGAQMKVYKYSRRVSEEAISRVPFLADMVNFKEDIDKLKQKFAVTSEVKVAVYPFSGDWLIYIKDKPFTRLRIRGGPQSKFYLLQGRTKD